MSAPCAAAPRHRTRPSRYARSPHWAPRPPVSSASALAYRRPKARSVRSPSSTDRNPAPPGNCSAPPHLAAPRLPIHRESVVKGKSVSVRVYLGGGRLIKKKKNQEQ